MPDHPALNQPEGKHDQEQGDDVLIQSRPEQRRNQDAYDQHPTSHNRGCSGVQSCLSASRCEIGVIPRRRKSCIVIGISQVIDQISRRERHPTAEEDGLENLIRQQGIEQASEQKEDLGRIRV